MSAPADDASTARAAAPAAASPRSEAAAKVLVGAITETVEAATAHGITLGLRMAADMVEGTVVLPSRDGTLLQDLAVMIRRVAEMTAR